MFMVTIKNSHAVDVPKWNNSLALLIIKWKREVKVGSLLDFNKYNKEKYSFFFLGFDLFLRKLAIVTKMHFPCQRQKIANFMR